MPVILNIIGNMQFSQVQSDIFPVISSSSLRAMKIFSQ